MFSSKVFGHVLMMLAIIHMPAIAAAQNLREMARIQAMRNPGVPLAQPAPPAHYESKTIEELAREADVVLRARLSKVGSYLTPNADRVLTDYSIVDPSVIGGRPPIVSRQIPGVVPPLILTVYGGEVIVEGVPIHGIDINREAIKDGGQYLLFLKPSRRAEPGRYEIHNGGIFEIVHEDVTALIKEADRVFKDTTGARLEDLISRIKAAVPVR